MEWFDHQNKVVLNYNQKYKVNVQVMHESLLYKQRRNTLTPFNQYCMTPDG